MKFNGIKIRDQILSDLKDRIEKLKTRPTLAVIWVGNDFATEKYVNTKQKIAETLGVGFKTFRYGDSVSAEEIKQQIAELNCDPKINGIIIQLPLPTSLNTKELIDLIDPNKDVDALRFCAGASCIFQPPTTMAIMRAIKESGIDIRGKTVAIIGRGFLVGAPLIRILKSAGAKLNIADSKTVDLGNITKDADMVISAVGRANIITLDMIKDGACLIDAGTSESKGALCGDIDPLCYKKSSFYSPCPGGVGPVTIAMLFTNLTMASERHFLPNYE